MSKKNQATKKARSKVKKPDEVFTAGPPQLVRRGRLVQAASSWTPQEHAQMRASLLENREKIRQDIAAKVSEAVELIKAYDPLSFTYSIFAKNNLVDPETYSELDHEGVEARVEYAQSLVTSVSNPGSKMPEKDQIDRFEECICSILDACLFYFMFKESPDGSPLLMEETKFLGMQRHLFVRGSSILEHDTDLVRRLFGPHDAFLQRRCSITTEELLQFCEDVQTTANAAFNELIQSFAPFKKIHQEFVASLDADPELDLDSAIARVRSSTQAKEASTALQKTIEKGPDFGFVIPVGTSPQLCNLLALSFGENKDFLTFHKSPGWPSNDSRIYTRPLIARDGKYYCPNPTLLMRSRATILESIVQNTDPQYYQNQFAEKRGKVVEEIALEHFRRLLPKAEIHPNLYYQVHNSAAVQRFETDGLVILDDRLFILEMKAGSFSTAAMRGAEKAMKNDLAHLIGEPYQQAQRTLQFISSNHPAKFEMADGSPAVSIADSNRFRRIYLVNITLSDIGHVAARLNSAREMGLVGSRNWPWSVYVNDLRVISEIIETPSEFLLYLERRLALNDLPAVSTTDELDYLGMFLKDGLFFTPKGVAGTDRFSMVGYTVSIDRYYDARAGRVQSGEKPRLNISDWYRRLVGEVEATGKADAYYVGMTLLSLDGKEHQRMESWFREYAQRALTDSEPHSLTLIGKDLPTLVVCVVSNAKFKKEELYDRYATLKHVQMSRTVILLTIEGEEMRAVDFKVFEGSNHAVVPSEALIEFRRTRYQKHFKINGKPGRNDDCPCNSGKKFKKCCIDLARQW